MVNRSKKERKLKGRGKEKQNVTIELMVRKSYQKQLISIHKVL
jgi:hypothetical protein